MNEPQRERPLYGHGVMKWVPTKLQDDQWRWDGLDADGRNIVMVDDSETMTDFLCVKPAPSVHPWYWDRRYDFASLIDWN